jgi:imidazole glycerol-phosphate synthase subunit HisH
LASCPARSAVPTNAGPQDPAHGLELRRPRKPESGNWAGLGAEPYFYFVHSYFPGAGKRWVIAAETTYGAHTFAAAIEMPNLFACQFHPEKSQDAGIRLIRNFLGI